MHVLDYPLIHEHQNDKNVEYKHVIIIIIIIILFFYYCFKFIVSCSLLGGGLLVSPDLKKRSKWFTP
jgi:hypothetical protein